MLDKQGQTVGQGAAAIQAGGNVVVNINQGLSATEVRQIVHDVLQTTLAEYKGVALAIAKARGEEVTEKFVTKLLADNPAGIEQAQTPDFQDSLFVLQKEYAKVGDEELGDLLVGLLVDQTKENDRTLLRNVLNEALRTAPRLSSDQISAISALFILFNVTNNGIDTLDTLGGFLQQHLKPFIKELENLSQASVSHLEFVGCGTNQPFASNGIEENFGRIYAGLFQKGITDQVVVDAGLSQQARALIIPCLNDSSQKQVAALNEQVLRDRAATVGLDESDIAKLFTLLQQGTMSPVEIRSTILSVAPYLKDLLDGWEKSPAKSFFLSVIGRAIAHGNVKRVIDGKFAPLSVWVS
jgi:hypothetical protein